MSGKFIKVFLILFFDYFVGAMLAEEKTLPILMPNVRPRNPETYLCYALPLNDTDTKFIVGFDPKASMKIVHHILLYGCGEPGKRSGAWDCGAMSHGHHHQHSASMPSDAEELSSGPTCREKSQTMYAWAKDAPKLMLPQDVAFQVGRGTNVKYIVLQVHYADVSSFSDGSADSSGVILHYTETPQPKSAGVITLATGGSIAPKTKDHFDVKCEITEDKDIHPFRFRTHTHDLGKFVSGYHIHRDDKGSHTWTRIGKMNPQLPQMFYPVENEVVVKKGDILGGRCTMENDKNTTTSIGSTAENEMCNFYIMYWSEKGQLETKMCSSSGPPTYYWEKDNLTNIPSFNETDE